MAISTIALVWYALGWAEVATSYAVGTRLSFCEGVGYIIFAPLIFALFIVVFPIMYLRELVGENEKNQYLWRRK